MSVPRCVVVPSGSLNDGSVDETCGMMRVLREDRGGDLVVRHRPAHHLLLQVHEHGGIHAGDLEGRAAARVVVKHLLAADVAVDDGLRQI